MLTDVWTTCGVGVTDAIPGINNLLNMIKTRRRRDSIIIGCIIGLCTVLLLSYMF